MGGAIVVGIFAFALAGKRTMAFLTQPGRNQAVLE